MKLLSSRTVEKPWGREALPAPFTAPAGRRVGEIWFEPPAQMSDVLVKYIFTSEKLSVQVHPSDEQAIALGEQGRGKEECWLVLDAEPGAMLGIGFRQPIDAETMRQAALDGSIEALMEWFPVRPGDFFYIPAGTVHAIGAGIALIEIQQNSDITYRLYDYGRPRELHLDKAVQVANGGIHAAVHRRRLQHGTSQRLVEGRCFSLTRVTGSCAKIEELAGQDGPFLVIPIVDSVMVAGKEASVSECVMVDALPDVGWGQDSDFLVVAAAR